MNDYITRAPRMIQGITINGFIKKENMEKANKAFEIFCKELQYGKSIWLACKRTKRKEKITLMVKECPKKRFSEEKPAYEVMVG